MYKRQASIFVVAVGIWTAVFDAIVPGGTGRITMRVGVGLVMAFVGSVLLVGTNAAQILHADLRGPIALTTLTGASFLQRSDDGRYARPSSR